MWKPTNQPVRAAVPVPPVFPTAEPQPPSQPTMQSTRAPNPDSERGSAAATEGKRVNVIFSAPQYQLLKSLAGRQGISVSDVLRQALSLTKLIVEADENPDERILIERKGQLQELRLVR